MDVALIGGTGFVGGYLVDALLDAGHRPSLLVRPGSENKVRHADACRVVSGDLSSSPAIRKTLESCDAAIYNVGILREHPRDGMTFEAMHYEGALRVIDAATTIGVERFVMMSANGVRRPGTPYQETKLRADEYLMRSGLGHTIFRPSVIFGDPRGTMEIATQLYREMIRLPLPAVGFHTGLNPSKGDVLMSPVHVDDVADAFVRSLDDGPAAAGIVSLGGPEVLSWTEMLRRIAEAVGRKKIIVPMPIGVMKLAATLFDRLPFFPVTRDQLTMLADGNTADPKPLEEIICRKPRRFSPANLQYLRS